MSKTPEKPDEKPTKPLDLEDKLAIMTERIELLAKVQAERERERIEALRREELQAQIDARQQELDQLEEAENVRTAALEAAEAEKQEAARVTKLQRPRASDVRHGDVHPAIRQRQLYG